jgi:hypothetical protein
MGIFVQQIILRRLISPASCVDVELYGPYMVNRPGITTFMLLYGDNLDTHRSAVRPAFLVYGGSKIENLEYLTVEER